MNMDCFNIGEVKDCNVEAMRESIIENYKRQILAELNRILSDRVRLFIIQTDKKRYLLSRGYKPNKTHKTKGW